MSNDGSEIERHAGIDMAPDGEFSNGIRGRTSEMICTDFSLSLKVPNPVAMPSDAD